MSDLESDFYERPPRKPRDASHPADAGLRRVIFDGAATGDVTAALDAVAEYLLAAPWPVGTPMEAHRQEVIAILDRALFSRATPPTGSGLEEER